MNGCKTFPPVRNNVSVVNSYTNRGQFPSLTEVQISTINQTLHLTLIVIVNLI